MIRNGNSLRDLACTGRGDMQTHSRMRSISVGDEPAPCLMTPELVVSLTRAVSFELWTMAGHPADSTFRQELSPL